MVCKNLISKLKLIGLQTRKAHKHYPDKTDLFYLYIMKNEGKHIYLWAYSRHCIRSWIQCDVIEYLKI